MFSALDDVKDKIQGFELGIDDYITKPYNFSEVLARIRVVLRNRELYAQIVVRESRLSLAEELNKDIKLNLLDFVAGIDDLDAAIAAMAKDGEDGKNRNAGLFKTVLEKSKKVRKQVAELDARIDRTNKEWDKLKKNEIDLPRLENQIRDNMLKE